MIPFSPPYIDDDVIREVEESLRSGWITTGPKTRQFEKELAEYCGVPRVLCVSSATSGLVAMLHWFGVGPGDEVIVPAYTYNATAQSVAHLGATPVMVDVGEDFNMDPRKVARAITARTKVVIPVDIAGWPCDYEALNEVVTSPEARNQFQPSGKMQEMLGRVLVLSDAAHSIGAVYNGRKSGSLADVSVFSFHAVKNITTAEGGAICLNLPRPFDPDEIYKRLGILVLHGQSKDAYAKTQAGNWRYDVNFPGFKANMPDVLAAIGLAQFRKYDEKLLPARKRIFQWYDKAFDPLDWAVTPPSNTQTATSACHVYLLRVNDITEAQRDDMIRVINGKGVSVNVHFIPLPMLTLFREQGYNIDDYPVTYRNYATEISLPVYPQLSRSDVDQVIEAVSYAHNNIGIEENI